jgi:hypothetical protein
MSEGQKTKLRTKVFGWLLSTLSGASISEGAKTKLTRWLIFGGIFSTLPFIGSGILWAAKYHKTTIPFYFYYLWERGELLVVSAAFAADAVGECISFRKEFLKVRIWSAGICVGMLFIEAIWFAALQSFDEAYDPITITLGSVVLFLVTLVAAGVCKTCAALLDEVES